MNELLDYFIKMGMSPEVAAELAQKVSVSAPPEPPIANGIKLSPDDAVVNLLTTRYGMDPKMAMGYAGHVIAGHATGSREIQEEAMSRLAGREEARLQAMGRFAHAAKIPADQRDDSERQIYDFIDGWAKDKSRKEAGQFQADENENIRAGLMNPESWNSAKRPTTTNPVEKVNASEWAKGPPKGASPGKLKNLPEVYKLNQLKDLPDRGRADKDLELPFSFNPSGVGY